MKPHSKDVIMQNYRRAIAHSQARQQILARRYYDRGRRDGVVWHSICTWIEQWRWYLRATRDEHLDIASRYQAKKRHARDAARRGNLRRRGQ